MNKISVLKRNGDRFKDILNQKDIVEQRLYYYFKGTGDNKWNIPKDMPFMKEFLNDIEKLCNDISK